MKQYAWIIFLSLIGSACTMGPDYKRPNLDIPKQYKETPKGWKKAEPKNQVARGAFWEIYRNRELDALENRLMISNQSMLQAKAQYEEAMALVDEARASYFPTLSTALNLTRQRTVNTTNTSSSSANAGSSNTQTAHSLNLTASWEPDLWGNISRTVEENQANADAALANWNDIRLSMQASLAQYYFELRGLDRDQSLLESIVKADKKILDYTQNQYRSGIAAEADILQAKSQLETAEANTINNGVNRALYEHAIAVLIGVPPADFTLAKKDLSVRVPELPPGLPSTLLERRPDVSEAERQIAAANASIGVAMTAYFPALTLNATGSVTQSNYANWFSVPALAWALGSSLSETILDGGFRSAAVRAADASYQAAVANYKQTVLSAFQNVEDNLASLRILNQEVSVLNQAAKDAKASYQIVLNEYQSGTQAYAAVLVAKTTADTAEKAALDLEYLRLSTSVALIKALGGSWATTG